MNWNQVTLAGRLTRDVELRYTPSQVAVAEFGLAVNERWMGKDGEKHEDTCFVDCTAFRATATNIQKFFGKGKEIFVSGKLKYDSWEKDGVKRSKLTVSVREFQFCGGSDNRQEPGAEPPPQGHGQGGAPMATADSDIPF